MAMTTTTATSGLTAFLRCSFVSIVKGGRRYYTWLAILVVAMIPGLFSYVHQLKHGLGVTGMSDQIAWGAYIANFTYLVGMAAAAVMLVIPAYVFHNQHAQRVVMIGEALAVAACTMALLFVVVDLGAPFRFMHLLPIIGAINFPDSVMAWDVIVLNGYLVINLAIPAFLLYRRFMGREAHSRAFFIVVGIAIVWAIALHTVTAFLFSSNSGRTFWHTALLGPRFLASAFAAGPAVILIAFRVIHETTTLPIPKDVVRFLGRVVAIALQVNLFMLFAEAFTELYQPTTHSASFEYLVLGHGEHTALVPWMRTALVFEVVALVILMVERLARRGFLLFTACTLTVVGVWIEKGIGLIVPGFVPTALGEVVEYVPTLTEISISLSIWAFGVFLFTVLLQPIIAIGIGEMRFGGSTSKFFEGGVS
jgi:Ni/Fe-hydrogenase subunit HybB-like protein